MPFAASSNRPSQAMYVLSHPTGNSFVRSAAAALERAGLLASLNTTIGVASGGALARLPFAGGLQRRRYDVRPDRLATHPLRESVRLAASRLGAAWLVKHETGWASADAVYRDLDRSTARALPRMM